MNIMINLSKHLDEIKNNGYTLISGTPILTQEDKSKLKNFLKYQFENKINLNLTSDNTPVINNIIGRDKEIDLIIEKLVLSKNFIEISKEILGENFKIWEVSSRISTGTDSGLSMHQDAKGQMNFWFILSDQLKPSGVTAFLPKSHLFDRIASKVGWSPINISRFFLKPLLGKDGDFAFFINKTWHARLPNIYEDDNFTFAIGMFSQDSNFKGNKEYLNINLDHINKLKKYMVYDYKSNDEKETYCMKIEKIRKFNLKIFILNTLFYPINLIRKIKNL